MHKRREEVMRGGLREGGGYVGALEDSEQY